MINLETVKIKIGQKSGRLIRFLKCNFRILVWTFPVLLKAFYQGSTKKRLIVIYDLTIQPFSIGDVLLVNMAGLVLNQALKNQFIDILFFYRSTNPKSKDPSFRAISEDNVGYYLTALPFACQMNQNLGSILIFNSKNQAEDYISNQIDNTDVWPSGGHVNITKNYLHYHIFEKIIYPFFIDHGYLPKLAGKPYLNDLANDFFQKHLLGTIPVTINLRNNPHFQTHRNASIQVWINFFNYCEKNYPVKFILICASSEIDFRFRECKNVLIAKDFHTQIDLELALIANSAIHMGSSSGPASVAWFSSNPYFIVNSTMRTTDFSVPVLVYAGRRNLLKFIFSKPHQHLYTAPESEELLVDEFNLMYESIDHNNKIVKKSFCDVPEFVSWLR